MIYYDGRQVRVHACWLDVLLGRKSKLSAVRKYVRRCLILRFFWPSYMKQLFLKFISIRSRVILHGKRFLIHINFKIHPKLHHRTGSSQLDKSCSKRSKKLRRQWTTIKNAFNYLGYYCYWYKMNKKRWNLNFSSPQSRRRHEILKPKAAQQSVEFYKTYVMFSFKTSNCCFSFGARKKSFRFMFSHHFGILWVVFLLFLWRNAVYFSINSESFPTVVEQRRQFRWELPPTKRQKESIFQWNSIFRFQIYS